MQESRLFKIVYYLLEKGHATAKELAKLFEVSIRTIYRDVDSLSASGIPIYAEAGRSGGIYLMKDFVLDKAVLSKEEKQEILFALQSIGMLQNNEEILKKLSAIFGFNMDNWLEIDFSRWGISDKDNSKFDMLKSAILHSKCVQITYVSSYEEQTNRIVHPQKLIYKSKFWYLKAYCTLKQDLRLFKLTRITNVEVLSDDIPQNKSYKIACSPINISLSDINTKEIYNQIVLRFSKEVSYRVYDEFDLSQMEIQENGDILVSAKLPEDAWLTGYLLSFGTQVDIISPIHLKKVISDIAKNIYEKNKI